MSTWRPNYCAMASEELPLADSLTIVAFPASFRDLPRPIVKKLLAPVTPKTQKLQLFAKNAIRANDTLTVVLLYCSRFPVKFSYKLIYYKLRNRDFYVKAIIPGRSVYTWALSP